MIEVFKLPFMQQALIASLMVAIGCSVLGVSIVLRRVVFVGAALAQISAAGIALALMLGIHPNGLSFIAALAGVILFSIPRKKSPLPTEAFIGIGYILASALSILFVAHSPRGEDDVMNVLFGNVLTVGADQLYLLAGTLVVILLIQLIFSKQFLFTSFDPEVASATGMNPRVWDFLFYLCVGLLISVSIRVAGALVTFCLLVIPAASGLLLARGMKSALIISGVVGALSAFLGLYLSFISDLPTGPTVVASSGILLLIASLLHKIHPSSC